jgi:hypothetical protein
MVEAQELHCHACDRYVQFTLDLSLDGNHTLECPNCGHAHCRVVRDGRITGERWDQRNGYTYIVIATSYSNTSTYSTYGITSTRTYDSFLYQSWANSSTVSSAYY